MQRYKFHVLLLLLVLILQSAAAQIGRIPYNNQKLFLSGANLAWVNFASDIGPGTTDFSRIADILLTMHDHGGNALRWWLHTNGAVTPAFNDSGRVIGPGQDAIDDMKKVLDLAWEREIGVKLCLWSFDMLRSSNSATVLARNKLLLNDTSYARSYINKCLIPMVTALKGHPAIVAWEVFNEPEGMSNEFGWSDIQHIPMVLIQRFVNLCAGAIHRTDSAAQVTSGAWSFYALTDVPTEAKIRTHEELSRVSTADRKDIEVRFAQKYRMSLSADEIFRHMENAAAQANYNYYSDSRLIAAGGDSAGTLDFYCVHYYDWGGTAISPFHHWKGYWALDKQLVVAEFAIKNTFGIPKEKLYDTLYQTGYAGALAWSWTDVTLSSPEDMLASMQYMWDNHRADVDVKGIGGDWPTVNLTSPVSGAKFAENSQITITADAADADGSIASVEFFYADTVRIGVTAAAPYAFSWNNVAAGNYLLSAVASDNQGHKRTSNKVSISVGSITRVKLEAESAGRSGLGMTVRSDAGASGGACLDMATQSGTVTWNLSGVPAAGTYDVAFGFKLAYDHPKSQYVNVNGMRTDTVAFDGTSTSTWYEKSMSVRLQQGDNTIQMELFWGWMYLDYLSVPSTVFASVGTRTNLIPVSTSLEQNFPNPFNPATTITFSLAAASDVRITVHNVLGQNVATLIDRRMDAGLHSVVLNAGTLSSGVYFSRMRAGAFGSCRKMLLLR